MRGQAIPLLGRAAELDRLDTLLVREAERLVTITGPPGVGKTRLAREVEATFAHAFPEGIVFVDLSPLIDAKLVLQTIARSVVVGEGEADIASVLMGELRNRRTLLILDNFEQVMGAVPEVTGLLASVPTLQILVTSREALRVRWERQVPLGPLAVAGRVGGNGPRSLEDVPAVALFLQQARIVDPAFALTGETAPTVADLCARLEGLPLAIELAAGWVGALSPIEILRRLEHRLTLLMPRRTEVPGRHASLRAAIGWSYALLSPAEQELFRRLSVFAGGAGIESIEAVCAPSREEDVLSLLASLVEKSLLLRASEGGDPRFRMLETIREFGWEQLAVAGEDEPVRRRHAKFFLDQAERASSQFFGPEQRRSLDLLAADHDNLRVALAWCLNAGESEMALRLSGALDRFWLIRGHLTEGRTWLGRALASGAGSPEARAMAFRAAGVLAREQGDYTDAARAFEEALRLSRGLGDLYGMATVLNHLGLLAWEEGQPDAAGQRYDEAIALFRELGRVEETSRVLNNLAMVAAAQKDYPRAIPLYEEALAIRRRVGDDWSTAAVLQNLADALRDVGRLAEAGALYLEGLSMLVQLGDRRGLADGVESLGRLAFAAGKREAAVRLLAAGQSLRAAVGAATPALQRAGIEKHISILRSRLSPVQFEAAWEAGTQWGPREVLDQAEKIVGTRSVPSAAFAAAVQQTPTRASEASAETLTGRERQVAELISRGLSNREIAEALFITENTAMTHVRHILSKLGLRSRAQVASWVTRED